MEHGNAARGKRFDLDQTERVEAVLQGLMSHPLPHRPSLAELRRYLAVLVEYSHELHRNAAAARQRAVHCREAAVRAVATAARLRAGTLAALRRDTDEQ